MISATSQLTNLLYSSSSIKIGSACTLEYNMNTMLDNIVVTYAESLEDYYPTTTDGRINLFKKLFPIDSIAKPNRPIESGIKYYIMLSNDISAYPYEDYRNFPYPKDSKPRMYYPATTNYYKYWVTPENQAVDITIRYIQHTATIASAYSTGPEVVGENTPYPNRVIYTTTSPHGFTANQTVSISGGTALNLSNQTIATIVSPTQFMIENTVAKAESTGGTATLSSPTKPALANKIVVRFEKYHKVPTTCDLVITYADNSVASGTTGISVPADGNLILYWNGTAWSTSMPYSSSQPISWPDPKQIKSIRLHNTGLAGAGRIFGLREISARWVKDISSDIVNFNIQKESTATEDSLLPVGTITSNSLQLNLAKYDQNNIKFIAYNRDEDWNANPNNFIYLYKDVEVNPYLTIYHADGAVTDGSTKYDRTLQGTFYIDTYDVTTYGDTQINGLDGAKYLMQTIPINLYLENSPMTSCIMTMLDTVGFTNYKFNLDSNDTSIPVLAKWWTDNQKTTWDHLQELCRDAQINAFFDENNVLQFYSRQYMYNKTSIDWNFYNSATTVNSVNRLPSIVQFTKKELATANQVKIIWRTPISSLYESGAEGLWSSEPSYMVAGGLVNTLEANTKAESLNFQLNFSDINNQQDILSSFNFNGYFLINSEIFEYDAIEYDYVLEGSTTVLTEWIESKSQWAAIRAGTKVGAEYFKPTGRFRIKKRGVFGTPQMKHLSTVESSNNLWTLVKEDLWNV